MARTPAAPAAERQCPLLPPQGAEGEGRRAGAGEGGGERWRSFALLLALPTNMRDDGRLLLPGAPLPLACLTPPAVRAPAGGTAEEGGRGAAKTGGNREAGAGKNNRKKAREKSVFGAVFCLWPPLFFPPPAAAAAAAASALRAGGRACGGGARVSLGRRRARWAQAVLGGGDQRRFHNNNSGRNPQRQKPLDMSPLPWLALCSFVCACPLVPPLFGAPLVPPPLLHVPCPRGRLSDWLCASPSPVCPLCPSAPLLGSPTRAPRLTHPLPHFSSPQDASSPGGRAFVAVTRSTAASARALFDPATPLKPVPFYDSDDSDSAASVLAEPLSSSPVAPGQQPFASPSLGDNHAGLARWADAGIHTALRSHNVAASLEPLLDAHFDLDDLVSWPAVELGLGRPLGGAAPLALPQLRNKRAGMGHASDARTTTVAATAATADEASTAPVKAAAPAPPPAGQSGDSDGALPRRRRPRPRSRSTDTAAAARPASAASSVPCASPSPSCSSRAQSRSSWACHICQKQCSCQSALEVHLRTHSGEKPFSCAACGKRFARKSHLTVHRRVHSGERPFSCDICGHRFAQASNLKAHARTHTGEKPYACDQCDKTFSASSSLKAHRSLHEIQEGKRRVLRCDVCDKPFNWRNNLRKHRRVHHPDAPPAPRPPKTAQVLTEKAGSSAGRGRKRREDDENDDSNNESSDDSASYGRYTVQWANVGAEYVDSTPASVGGPARLPASLPQPLHTGLAVPLPLAATSRISSASNSPLSSPLRDRGQTAIAMPTAASPKAPTPGAARGGAWHSPARSMDAAQ